MTTIREGPAPLTLINVFTVTPDRQQELADMLAEVTERGMRHRPGFVSANIHRSLDGTKVVNYAQWETREHFETMLADPEAQVHMRACSEIGTAEPGVYEVSSVHEAELSSG